MGRSPPDLRGRSRCPHCERARQPKRLSSASRLPWDTREHRNSTRLRGWRVETIAVPGAKYRGVLAHSFCSRAVLEARPTLADAGRVLCIRAGGGPGSKSRSTCAEHRSPQDDRAEPQAEERGKHGERLPQEALTAHCPADRCDMTRVSATMPSTVPKANNAR